MAKKRIQTGNSTIKKEEEDVKPTLVLNGVNNTRSSGRIAKKRSPIANNRQLPARQVKVEEDTDTKSLLQSLPKPSKAPKSQKISQEQINQLIHYIVSDNMSIHKAAIEVNIFQHSGCKYFHKYINDPEKKIPSPQIRDMQTVAVYTPEQVQKLIQYID